MLLGPPHGSSRCAPSTQWPLYNRPPTHAAAAPPTATVSSNVAAGIVVGAGSAVSAPYSSAAATRQRDRDSDALGMRRWRLALISLLCCDAARRHMLRFRAEVLVLVSTMHLPGVHVLLISTPGTGTCCRGIRRFNTCGPLMMILAMIPTKPNCNCAAEVPTITY